jgi:hypothetical protein
MIHVDRGLPPPGLGPKAQAERAFVVDLYEVQDYKGPYDFAAYRSPGVADTLRSVFHGKCAYCESKMVAVMPGDVDHFRPKSAVLVRDVNVATGEAAYVERKPGYYWLAAEWSNLLPACIFCNRPNRHLLPESERKQTRGKAAHFPLVDEVHRARKSTDSLDLETALLLDPCGPLDPRAHLQFHSDGIVTPRQINGSASPLGERTIDVLALQRPDLIIERRARAAEVRSDLDLILRLMPDVATDTEARLNQAERLVSFARYFRPNAIYIAVAMDMADEMEPGFSQAWPIMYQRASLYLQQQGA